jgi:hypothetical protein
MHLTSVPVVISLTRSIAGFKNAAIQLRNSFFLVLVKTLNLNPAAPFLKPLVKHGCKLTLQG